ncbi:helix-turn-helix domain-containing protein [Clostridium sp. SHJSY1]|uniref:PucR family transcriptional regulator n=1 Tax=Clostridium sp. SHJSY1 TaxID=2942483 RepID=UPI002874153A|nr:helix-turn-helix domain-containing protein [Clostridium sp. SHJSY1]MDS0528537.1 helix-turn-helix domain-containing protein [Clostridium sp. SHJSY1]
MIKIETILCFLKNKLGCRIWGEYEEECIIEDVGLLEKDMTFNTKTIYLAKEISNITREINILTIVEKLDTSINILQIETSTFIEDIYREIRKFIYFQYKIYAKKSNLYSSLYKCNSINDMLNIGEKYLNNPIYILDTSYRILCGSKGANSIEAYVQHENGETYLLMDTINIMKKDKCMEDIYKSKEAFFKSADNNLIFCGIRIDDITVSYICILEEYRKFVEEDLELVNALSEVISLQMQKDNLFINKSGLEEEYYLMDLLIGRIKDINYMKQRLGNINFKVNKNFCLITIPFSQSFHDYRHNFALKQLINSAKNILGSCIAAYYEDKINLLVGSERNDVISKNIKEKFTEFLMLNNLKAAISSIFSNILQTRDFYVQAICTLELSEHLREDKNLLNFNDYLEYYLFHTYENGHNNKKRLELNKLIHPLINKLMEIDNDTKGELLKTLIVYLESNRNASIASKKLNIHCSTFFYRFHKIENLLDVSLNDSEALFKFELSFKILKYLKIGPCLN